MIVDRSCRKRRAITLVEIVIAIALLAVMSISVISSFIYSSQTTRLNSNAFAAKNIAQGYFERMAVDTFANVATDNYPDVDYDSTPPVWLDEALEIPCKVDIEFKGFGTAENGSDVVLADNEASWEINEWQGDQLYLVDGPGAGQFVLIAGNTENTLTLGSALFVPVTNGTRYMINNGKTVEITTTWEYKAQEYSQTIESLVINFRNDQNLGF